MYKFKFNQVINSNTIEGTIDIDSGLTVIMQIALFDHYTTTQNRTKKYLENLLALGPVSIKPRKAKQNSFGPFLADIYVRTIHVQSSLLKLGLAKSSQAVSEL